MDIIKDVASVLGCIVTAITLVTLIFKPIRNKIINSLTAKSAHEKTTQKLDNLAENVDKILDYKEGIFNRLDSLDGKVDSIEKRVLSNEGDRLKSELFSVGNRCRRGMTLHPEEFEHIRTVFHKYHDTLGLNSDGEKEYSFIYDYYNKQQIKKN